MTDQPNDTTAVTQKKIVCWASPGCVHQCGLIATVEDGRLVRLRGNPDYPTPNHGCSDRMPHHIKWLYSPEQLLHPLKRVGERGEDRVGADPLGPGPRRDRRQTGRSQGRVRSRDARPPRGDLPQRHVPHAHPVPQPVRQPLQHRLRRHHLPLQHGRHELRPPRRSRTAVPSCSRWSAWCSTATTSATRRRSTGSGCAGGWRPRRPSSSSSTRARPRPGSYADLWLQLRPGTDTALLMAWINVIIEEGLYDKAFVEEWTSGFDELRARAAEYPPERVAEITWVARRSHPRVGPHVRHQQTGRLPLGLGHRHAGAQLHPGGAGSGLSPRHHRQPGRGRRRDGGGAGTDGRRQDGHPRLHARVPRDDRSRAAQEAARFRPLQAHGLARLRGDGARITKRPTACPSPPRPTTSWPSSPSSGRRYSSRSPIRSRP